MKGHYAIGPQDGSIVWHIGVGNPRDCHRRDDGCSIWFSPQERHDFELIFEDENGDLFRCSCGFQAYDFAKGRAAYIEHLADVGRL